MKIRNTGLVLLTVCLMGLTSCGDKKTSSTGPSVNAVNKKATAEGKIPTYEVTEYKYNSPGELMTQTIRVYNKFDDPLSEKIEFSTWKYWDYSFEYEYNADGLMLRQLSDGYKIYEYLCTYDDSGELLTTENLSKEHEIEKQCRYENEYGDNEKLSVVKMYEGDLVYTMHYTYDENGNLSEYRRESGNIGVVITYEHDENGNTVRERKVGIKNGEEMGLVTEYISTYNSHDLLETKEEYTAGHLSFTYKYEYEFYE